MGLRGGGSRPQAPYGPSHKELVSGGGWRLEVVGGWRLVVGSWQRLAVGGGWWLAVGGPWRLSLRAVLSPKKVLLKEIWSGPSKHFGHFEGRGGGRGGRGWCPAPLPSGPSPRRPPPDNCSGTAPRQSTHRPAASAGPTPHGPRRRAPHTLVAGGVMGVVLRVHAVHGHPQAPLHLLLPGLADALLLLLVHRCLGHGRAGGGGGPRTPGHRHNIRGSAPVSLSQGRFWHPLHQRTRKEEHRRTLGEWVFKCAEGGGVDTTLWLAPPPPPCVTFCRIAVSLRGPGQSPVLPFACCVGSLRSVGRCGRWSCWCRFHVRGAQSLVCRGCAGCGGMCRLRVSGAQELAYWGLCWLLPGSFDCFCRPRASVHRPSAPPPPKALQIRGVQTIGCISFSIFSCCSIFHFPKGDVGFSLGGPQLVRCGIATFAPAARAPLGEGGGVSIEPPKTREGGGGFRKGAQLTGPSIS